MGNISLFSSLFILYYNVQVKANIRQWGKCSKKSNDKEQSTYGMNFPITFSKSVFSIVFTPFVFVVMSGSVCLQSYSTSGFTIVTTYSSSIGQPSNVNIFAIAIGI